MVEHSLSQLSLSDTTLVSESRKSSIANIEQQMHRFVEEYFKSLKMQIPAEFKAEISRIARRKYELVVIGNTNVGKSTFLN